MRDGLERRIRDPDYFFFRFAACASASFDVAIFFLLLFPTENSMYKFSPSADSNSRSDSFKISLSLFNSSAN